MLLKRGRSPLMTIVTESKMPIRTVRESLFVLMQHGLVKYAESPEGQRLIAHYVAISENIIRRTRYPLYLYKAGLEFGPIVKQCCIFLKA